MLESAARSESVSYNIPEGEYPMMRISQRKTPHSGDHPGVHLPSEGGGDGSSGVDVDDGDGRRHRLLLLLPLQEEEGEEEEPGRE